ncbi:LysR substrate-binding domain-containing protein [Streptomyces sp. NPDC005549]|uniref:LysR substrate-binding domain-containing protein n=1 Tax=Streptomyces sp. NPDC005549 TaxID=3154888 RepID=UPI0033A965B9
MLINQLEYACEIVDQGFNLSKAAEVHHTSQPSVSRHIQALEKELGFQIFARSKRRILGLTEPGQVLIESAREILAATNSLKYIRDDYVSQESGTLVISASHSLARYVLPQVIQDFSRRSPQVRIVLRQENPELVEGRVLHGEADLGFLSRNPLQPVPAGLGLLPCYEEPKVLITPEDHPLLTQEVTLESLAKHPLITVDTQFTTHSDVMSAFRTAGFTPNVVLSATDVDVIKTYVRHGFGIAILGRSAYSAQEDTQLRATDLSHLIRSHQVCIELAVQAYVRRYVTDFISLFAPEISRRMVLDQIRMNADSSRSATAASAN